MNKTKEELEDMYHNLEKLLIKTQDSHALAGMLYLSDLYGIETEKTDEYIIKKIKQSQESEYDPLEAKIKINSERGDDWAMYYIFGLISAFSGLTLNYYGVDLFGFYLALEGIRNLLIGSFNKTEDKLDYSEALSILRSTKAYKHFKKKGIQGIKEFIKQKVNYYKKYKLKHEIITELLGSIGIAGALQITQMPGGKIPGLIVLGAVGSRMAYSGLKIHRYMKYRE